MAQLSFKRYSTTSALNTAKTSFKQGDVIFDAQAKIIYVVTTVSGSSATLEPYYGNKNIVSATSNGPTVTLTYADGGTSNFTIDNVSHAVNDSAGNNIIETYAKITDLQPIANKLSEFEYSIRDIATWMEHPEADEITANVLNASEYINLGGNFIVPSDVANIQNLSTINTNVASLQTDVTALKTYFSNGVANTAAKLSTSAGSATLPVYFSGGKPVACTASSVFSNLSNSGNNISITVAGQNRTLTVGYATNAGTAAACSGNAATATTASKLGTNAGSTTLPVYFANGVPVACAKESVFSNLSNSGNNISVTVAGQNRTLQVNYATNAGTASTCSGNAATATTASKTQAALTFGSKTFNGSTAQTITAADLGLSSALKFCGTSSTALTDGATTKPITLSDNSSLTPTSGNVVLYGHKEFMWTGSLWEEIGDESSFALKSVQINAGSGLTGGGTLESTRTISHADTSNQASISASGRRYITGITLDGFGHVTGLSTGTEVDQTSISGNAATANTLYTARTLWGQSFNGSKNIDGTIRITPNEGSYSEGIRIKPYQGWSTILLGGTDLTANTGTSAASWSLHAYTGNFYLNRSANNANTSYILCNVSGNWGIATNAPSYKLHVNGTLGVNGTSTLAGDVTANSNVNVALQTKSTTFNVANGCVISYDSTNKCLKFTF